MNISGMMDPIGFYTDFYKSKVESKGFIFFPDAGSGFPKKIYFQERYVVFIETRWSYLGFCPTLFIFGINISFLLFLLLCSTFS